MRSALRSIDRYLVCQVIQVLLEPIVEDYIARWLHAMDEGDTPPGPSNSSRPPPTTESPYSPTIPSGPTWRDAPGATASPTLHASSPPSSTATRR